MDRDTIDSNGIPIPDISDWELDTILSILSRTKGHRITVILDCCHAGSITRAWSSGARTAPPPERASLKDMLLAAEDTLRDLPASGNRSIFAEDWSPDMGCHVIVAACGEKEAAKANRIKKEKGTEVRRGVSTGLLIETLRVGVSTLLRLYPKSVIRRQLWQEDTLIRVFGMSIDPYGSERRHFLDVELILY